MILAFDLTHTALFLTYGACDPKSTEIKHHSIPLNAQGISTALTSSLMPAIHRICPAIHSINMIAVTRGPASFTGLRILLSTLQGLCVGLPSPILAPTRFELLAQHTFQTQDLSSFDSLTIQIQTKQDTPLEQCFQKHILGPLYIEKPTEDVHHCILDEGLDLSQTLFLWARTLLHQNLLTMNAPFITLPTDLLPFYGQNPHFKKK